MLSMHRLPSLSCSSTSSVTTHARAVRAKHVSRRLRVPAVATDETASTAKADSSEQSASDGDILPPSLHSMTNEEWRAKFEKDGTVDLFTKDEFSANSFMVGGSSVFKGGVFGWGTGEGPSAGNCTKHKVKIINHYTEETVEVDVPEDRYVMWEAEEQGHEMPYSCRMGCCTACAVKVHEGELHQPQSLGISVALKEKGYALLCVAFPKTDCVVETVFEDEVYDLQFGQAFQKYALDRNADSVVRDDFAIELALGDE